MGQHRNRRRRGKKHHRCLTRVGAGAKGRVRERAAEGRGGAPKGRTKYEGVREKPQ